MAALASERPRVRVAALVLYDGRVVVVRHRKDQQAYHLLPGGGVGWGETLHDALVREVAEETGLIISPGRLVAVSDTIAPDGSRHVVNVVFDASVDGGSITDSPDDPRVEAVELVSPDGLEALDLRPPIAGILRSAIIEHDTYRPEYLGSVFSPQP